MMDPTKPLWAQMSPKAQAVFNTYRQAQVQPAPRPERWRIQDIRKSSTDLNDYWTKALAEATK